jgi:hypothetical protein
MPRKRRPWKLYLVLLALVALATAWSSASSTYLPGQLTSTAVLGRSRSGGEADRGRKGRAVSAGRAPRR